MSKANRIEVWAQIDANRGGLVWHVSISTRRGKELRRVESFDSKAKAAIAAGKLARNTGHSIYYLPW